MDVELKIEGMGCAHCVGVLRAILEEFNAKEIRVELGRAQFILADADALQMIIERIDQQGYRVVDAID